MNSKQDINYIDKFLYKLFFFFIILFITVFLDKVNIINYNKLKEKMSEEANILEIVDYICGDSAFFQIEADYDSEVSSSTFEDVFSIEEGYKVILGQYEAVETVKTGIVTKIEKEDDLYRVTLKSKDGVDFIYSALTTIDVHMYQVVSIGDILGKGQLADDKYYYNLKVVSDGELVDYYS